MLFWLAHLHPAWMVVSIGLAAAALRSGLAMRSARLRRGRRPKGARERHLRLAKAAVAMVLVGFFAGLASAFWLRGWGVFSTAHGFVSSLALLLFVATAREGRALETGASRHLDRHAFLALAAVGTAVAAFFTGFVLLP